MTKVIPRGLGYFWVAFGGDFQGGFAHVIEDEDYFSRDFGKVKLCFFVVFVVLN